METFNFSVGCPDANEVLFKFKVCLFLLPIIRDIANPFLVYLTNLLFRCNMAVIGNFMIRMLVEVNHYVLSF